MRVSKIILLVTLVIVMTMLVGCGTTDPIIKIVTQTVEVPVAVPCKEIVPPEPDYCFIRLDDSSDIYTQVRCLLSDRKLSLGYETELNAKLKACK